MFSWPYFSKKNYPHPIPYEKCLLYFLTDVIFPLGSLLVSFLPCDPKYYQFCAILIKINELQILIFYFITSFFII